jgi:UDP-N-acetylmuramoyl-tripeptide--D-alanyl-D-alanine ligase
VVATPASFNNRAGLARAVNEHLADGTEVFVAEMGTYGPGEIADLCRWCPPDISVITAIGPVHLERFGSEERIVVAKSEILVKAGSVVLQVDDPRLAEVADRAEADGKRVMRCSAVDRSADVCVERGADGTGVTVTIDGTVVAEGVPVPTGVQPTNLACAVAVALLVEVTPEAVADRLAGLTAADHRLQAERAPSGVWILDDTYNSNPAGAAEALAALTATADAIDPAQEPGPRRRVVVTPGMVELGRRQFKENLRFGGAIAVQADHLVVVGLTNRRALLAGVALVPPGSIRVTLVRHREQAVEWVRTHLTSGDTVLYENDLPDHYP